ncbi:MAG: rRNA maturation RNase YbeY [Anaerolineae bacterium]
MAKVERARTWGEVGIVVMADEGIRRVNHSFLGHNRPTDVISFAYPPLPGADAWSGEVVVNVQRAVEAGRYWQARRAGWSPAHELALYVAHGCHHLSGADDATPVERRRMRAKELRWLRELEAEGCRLEALIANTEMKRPCW